MDVSAEDLTGKNLYDYCHAEDLQALRKSHVDCEYDIFNWCVQNRWNSNVSALSSGNGTNMLMA